MKDDKDKREVTSSHVSDMKGVFGVDFGWNWFKSKDGQMNVFTICLPHHGIEMGKLVGMLKHWHFLKSLEEPMTCTSRDIELSNTTTGRLIARMHYKDKAEITPWGDGWVLETKKQLKDGTWLVEYSKDNTP